MDPLALCMGCMSPRGAQEVCLRCGYKEGTPADSPLHLPPRTRLFGQYLVGKVLGHGGFGITYIGWDLNLERRLAVKEYFPSGVALRSDAVTVGTFSGKGQQDFEYGLNRYLEEARIVVRFSHHPNILSVINFFRENGTAYIVMEYLEGRTFEQFLADRGNRIDFEEALRILVPVMDALEEVHKDGILHRDISPDNIHIGKDRHVKLLDFGAARLAMGERSRNLSVILKEGYAPEEQYRSKGNQGPWTDVYALAATMYRAVTGVLPPGALDRMSNDEMTPPREYDPSMAPDQEKALLKALSVDLRKRFQSIRDFRVAIDPACRPVFPVPVPVPEREPLAQAPSVVTTAMAPTVRKVPTGAPESPADSAPTVAAQPPLTPISQPLPPQPRPAVPVWVWSALGGVVVLATLFFLRPRLSPVDPARQTVTQPAGQQPPPPAQAPPTEKKALTTPPVPVAAAKPAEAKPAPKPVAEKSKPPAEPPKPAEPKYEELLHQGEQAEVSNPAESEKILRAAIHLNPARWEAYNQLAQLLLYKLDRPAEAFPAYTKAIDFGGRATFRLLHQHREGEPGAARLHISKDAVVMDEPAQPSHSFTGKKSDIKELRMNREVLRRIRGGTIPAMFHIQTQTGDRCNLAGSSSKPGLEREMVVRLAGQK